MDPSNRWGGSLGHVQDGAMSNDSAAAIRQERRDWMAKHRDIYLQSGGTQGHVMDIREVGGHAFTTHCLIRVKGRKSGKDAHRSADLRRHRRRGGDRRVEGRRR